MLPIICRPLILSKLRFSHLKNENGQDFKSDEGTDKLLLNMFSFLALKVLANTVVCVFFFFFFLIEELYNLQCLYFHVLF